MADSNLKTKDYEKIGRALEAVVMYGYASKKRLFGANFLRGLFFGLGASLGASIALALILYLLTFFSELPLVGELFERAENAVEDVRQPETIR